MSDTNDHETSLPAAAWQWLTARGLVKHAIVAAVVATVALYLVVSHLVSRSVDDLAAERGITAPEADDATPDVADEPEPTDDAGSEFLGDEGLTADFEDPLPEDPSDDEAQDAVIDLLEGPERQAADFAAGLFTWTYEQPEADRVEQLTDGVSARARDQLEALADSWEILDEVRTFGQETATASVDYLTPGEFTPLGGDLWPMSVQLSVTRRADGRATLEQHRVEVTMARIDGVWLVESYTAS